MMFVSADPTEWWLEIPPDAPQASWRNQSSVSTPGRRWSAYLNQICLTIFLPWLQAEYVSSATAWPNLASLADFWEVVDGAAITVGRKRLVLLPTETLDRSELAVPQEWVDIPDWAADYYLPVQVDLDLQGIRIWGYATHQQLKTMARYDASDRTYCLEGHHLTRDLTVFWATYQFCPDEQTRAAVAPLPMLSVPQAENLLQGLGDPAVAFPRLAAPFQLWGALLGQPKWRRRLLQDRQSTFSGSLVPVAARVNLSQWFQAIFSVGWQSIDSLSALETKRLATCFRSYTTSNQTEVKQIKLIDLNTQSDPRTVALLVGLRPEANEKIGIQVQLYPTQGYQYLPENLRLALLSESGEVLQSIQTEGRDYYIQLNHFKGSLGCCFSLQVELDESSMMADFVV